MLFYKSLTKSYSLLIGRCVYGISIAYELYDNRRRIDIYEDSCYGHVNNITLTYPCVSFSCEKANSLVD